MRSVTRTFTALCALTTAFVAAAEAQAVIGPRSSAIPVSAQHDTIVVPVVVDLAGASGASLGSVTARLQWRASVLRFVGVSAGTFGAPAINPDSANGVLRIAAASATGATGTPTIVNARFQAIGPIGDTTLISLVVDEMTAAGTLAAIGNIPTSALVCVGSVAGRWGDATGDDQVLSNDALAIVTHAVGLSAPPLTTVNGDVDSSGTVTTRDALVVLSFAVGLNTSAFRVNQVKPSLCGAGSPITTLTLSPGTAQLLPGDRLPLAVVARDVTTAVIHTPRITYVSTNPAAATVDAAGEVTGVATGSADIIAILSPLLADTATVSVGGSRNIWYVSSAAGNAVEHGSAAYPFATIAQAVAAASADDTINIATGDYGEALVIDKPLTILGDSTAQGFPRIRPVAGAAVRVETAGGTVIVRRVELPSTDGGVRAHGDGSGLLELDRVRVSGSRSTGIVASGFGTVLITEGGIFGATDTGIEVDSTDDVQILRVTVDQVAGRSSGAPPGFTLRVRHVDNLTLDSVRLRGGRADVNVVDNVAITRSEIGETSGHAIVVAAGDSISLLATQFSGILHGPSDSAGVKLMLQAGGTVVMDSVGVTNSDGGITVFGARSVRARRLTVQLAGPGARAMTVTGADTVVLARGTFAGGDVHLAPAPGPGGLMQADTVTIQGGSLHVTNYASVVLRDIVASNGLDQLVKVAQADRVLMQRVEASAARFTPGAYAFGPFAIDVSLADTVTIDSVWVHDNAAGGLQVVVADTVGLLRSRFVANYRSSGTGQQATLYLQSIRKLRAARVLLDERGGASVYSMYITPGGTAGVSAVDSSTFIGSLYGVLAAGSSVDTMRVERSVMQSAGPQDRIQIGAYASGLGRVVYDGNTIDSATQMGLYAANVPSLAADNNTLRYLGNYGIYGPNFGGSGLQHTFTGNLVECDTSSNATGIFVGGAQVTAAGNTVRGCPAGIAVGGVSGIWSAAVLDNVIEGDTVDGSGAIEVAGFMTTVVVARNTVTRGRWGQGAIRVVGTMNSTRIDSNVVRFGRGSGVYTQGQFAPSGIQLRANRFDSLRIEDSNSVSEAAIKLGHFGGTVRIAHDTIRGLEIAGIYQEIWSGDTLRVDSTVIVDHPWFGIKLYDGGTIVAGFRNYIARNGFGMAGTGGIVAMSQSTFENNDTAATSANGSTWSMANNYWGHSTGPRCGASCPGALGDSVANMSGFLPFLTSPDPGTPMGVRISLLPRVVSAPATRRRPSPGAVGQMIPGGRE